MPRTGRGGRRQGTPGKTYGNRSDLRATKAQPVRTAPSGSYGEATASAEAQKALPLPQSAPPPMDPMAMASPPPMPGARPINRPTERPAEPLTAGMAMGAGPGPSAAMPAVDPVVETLRAAYRAFPNESIAALLEAAERG